MSEYYLIADGKEYPLHFDNNSSTTNEIRSMLLVKGSGRNIGGEIFYIVDIDIPFDGSEKEVFDIGDVVYWRSQKEEKFAIAIFYGNTKFGDGNAPRAASPCIHVAKITADCSSLETFTSDKPIEIIVKL